jgi:4-amino-4-deoxy-L-arabinose transferase-like glycosyltransferase
VPAGEPSDSSFGRWPLARVAISLFLGAFLFHAFGTWAFSLTYQDESRFTEATREMRERNDWVVPHFNGQNRFDKPPLTYWCQAVAMALFGETEFAARLPSILSAAFLAVVIFLFGARLTNPAAGFWATIMFSTNLVAVVEAKAATADMLLTLFMTLAFWAGWDLIRPTCSSRHDEAHTVSIPQSEPPHVGCYKRVNARGWWLLFYLSLALAFLAKGPIGWAPLVTLAIFQWWAKPSVMWSAFRFELGIPLTLGLIALWGVPAFVQTHGEYLRVGIGGHVLARMTTGFDGHGASNLWTYMLGLPTYLVVLAISFAGWSFWFPWAFKKLRAENGGAPEHYLLAGIVIIFGVFTLSRTRLPHYTLPAYPLVALLFTRLWAANGRSFRPFKVLTAGLAVIALAASLAAIWLVPRFAPGKDLARHCAPLLRPETAFGIVDLDQSSLIWYFRERVRDCARSLKPDEAAAFMAQPGPRFCVMSRAVAQEKFPSMPESWHRVDSADDRYYVGPGEKLSMTVLIKP